MSQRPQPGEFTDYHNIYISEVEGDQIVEALNDGYEEIMEIMENLPEDKWNYRYAPEKWTFKEVILHIIDTERIFAYRGLCIARNDRTPLPSFDQDLYAPYANGTARSAESLIEEYKTVRAASISLYKNLRNEDLARIGVTGSSPTSCRATAFIIAGHEKYHINIIRDKYL